MPPDSPRFWRQAFQLRQRRRAPGAGVAAPRCLAELAPALLAAGRAAALLRASRGTGALAGLPPVDSVRQRASMHGALAGLERSGDAAEQSVPVSGGPAHARLQRTRDSRAGDLYARFLGAAASLSEARPTLSCVTPPLGTGHRADSVAVDSMCFTRWNAVR